MATTYAIVGGVVYGNRSSYLENTDYACLVFDVTEQIDIAKSASVSQYPIEAQTDGSGGYTASDHVFNEQDKITIKGWVANNPSTTYNNNQLQSTSTRIKYAIDLLTTLKESKKLITIITEHEVLTNCVITDLSYSLTSETGTLMLFTLQFVRVQFVTYSTTSVSAANVSSSKKKVKTAATDKTNSGGGTNQKKELSDREKADAAADSAVSATASGGLLSGLKSLLK